MILNGKRPSAGVFDEMDSYWAEIADWNSTTKQVDFLESALKVEGLILDLCCGTGRHSIPLSTEGFHLIGLDVSPNLLRIAKERATQAKAEFPLVRGDMRHLPFKSEAFAAVMSMDTSFGYLQSEEEDVQSLREVQRVLGRSGLLLIDVYNREHIVLNHRKKSEFQLAFTRAFARVFPFFFKWREYPSFCMLQKRTLGNKGWKIHDLWIIRDKKTGKTRVFDHVVRLYAFWQLEMMLRKAGFRIKITYGSYDRQRFTRDSSRLIIIAERFANQQC
jgi:ubiquinone/menaquinone biosynthesis C-methylase UbiE